MSTLNDRLEVFINLGYVDLAYAIVKQAVDDYRELLLYKRRKEKQIEELENFFTSEYCKSLTGVDGTVLINKVKKEVYV